MMRLDKMLAHLNYGSRKEVKAYIRKGFVSVNGEIITDDDFKVNEQTDEIVFIDEKIHYQEMIYLILNKPAGYVSATFDSKEATVLDLIDGYEGRGLFPVGRLDKDTTGLLILTNDGKLAHQWLSPSKHVLKTYEVTFEGTFQEQFISMFEEGITLEDGTVCLPAKLVLLKPQFAQVTISEGKYHQVKRMFEMVGLSVIKLKRISFGGLALPKDLKEGNYRALLPEEIFKISESSL